MTDTPTVSTASEDVERRAARIERYAEQRKAESLNWAPGSALAVDIIAHAETIAGDAATLRALAKERDALWEGVAAAGNVLSWCAKDAVSAGMSWSGKNIIGDRASVDYVRKAVHYFEQMDASRDAWQTRLQSAETERDAARAEAARLREAILREIAADSYIDATLGSHGQSRPVRMGNVALRLSAALAQKENSNG